MLSGYSLLIFSSRGFFEAPSSVLMTSVFLNRPKSTFFSKFSEVAPLNLVRAELRLIWLVSKTELTFTCSRISSTDYLSTLLVSSRPPIASAILFVTFLDLLTTPKNLSDFSDLACGGCDCYLLRFRTFLYFFACFAFIFGLLSKFARESIDGSVSNCSTACWAPG